MANTLDSKLASTEQLLIKEALIIKNRGTFPLYRYWKMFGCFKQQDTVNYINFKIPNQKLFLYKLRQKAIL